MLHYSKEVAAAKSQNLPIVALESTIISHGMPYPSNLDTALTVEQIIREHGAVPATIALHQGNIHIGLEKSELEFFAESQSIVKASTADLAFVLSQNLSASTTVAATLSCCKLAGIQFFVTGGIGGVHYDVNDSFDISADLQAIAKHTTHVVCSGVKSILDIKKTLEHLESLSVPVVTYQQGEFPAFFSRLSGQPSPLELNEISTLTKMLLMHQKCELSGGVLIANPIPQQDEIPFETIKPIIDKSLALAKSTKGKAITPFLLKKINELTKGKSLQANISLIKNNAILGAKLAKAMQAQVK